MNDKYEALKEQAAKDILEGKATQPTLLIEFSQEFSRLVNTYINKMDVIEARVACKVVLQIMGLSPNMTDQEDDSGQYQPKQPGKY